MGGADGSRGGRVHLGVSRVRFGCWCCGVGGEVLGLNWAERAWAGEGEERAGTPALADGLGCSRSLHHTRAMEREPDGAKALLMVQS